MFTYVLEQSVFSAFMFSPPGGSSLSVQEKVPALLDVDARIAAEEGFIETKPHGHGRGILGVFPGGTPGAFTEKHLGSFMWM